MPRAKLLRMDDYRPAEPSSPLTHLAQPFDREITYLDERRREMARGLNLDIIRKLQIYLIDTDLESTVLQVQEKIQSIRREIRDTPTETLVFKINISAEDNWRDKKPYYKIILEELKRRRLIT